MTLKYVYNPNSSSNLRFFPPEAVRHTNSCASQGPAGTRRQSRRGAPGAGLCGHRWLRATSHRGERRTLGPEGGRVRVLGLKGKGGAGARKFSEEAGVTEPGQGTRSRVVF